MSWVGYELHPETPPGGVPLSEYLRDAAGMLRYVKAFAAGFGIPDLVPPERLARTRRALAAAEHAREVGRLAPFVAAVYDAYWRRREGVESDEELAAIAERARLEPAAAISAASDPTLLARVDAARAEALAAGVTGVPTFDVTPVAGRVEAPSRVVGCQRYDVLAEAVRRAGGRRRGGQPPQA